MIGGRGTPPRFVVRTMIAMFAVVAFVLSAALLLIAIEGNAYVRQTVADKLSAGQRMLSALEQRQTRELQTQAAMLAENPTLKAALDTYGSEMATGETVPQDELVATVQRELEKLDGRLPFDALAVSDTSGRVLAIAGRARREWSRSLAVETRRSAGEFVTVRGAVYRRVTARITIQDTELGLLELATALDDSYVEKLSVLSGTNILVLAGGRAAATTLPTAMRRELEEAAAQDFGSLPTRRIGGEEYAVQLLFESGPVAVYALDSIDASAAPVRAEAMRAMAWIGVAAFVLAALASLWMARTLSRPLDRLSRSLSAMTASRTFDERLPATGSSLEVDALTHTFNSMMESVAAAEAETRSAYIGAIRALAQALDARDPYTAGHSERVSAIAVVVGREIGLAPEDLDVLRLGALLHDIGKIGVGDEVLRKPSALTEAEYELIKEHPALGARILRNVPLLAPHLPIVELHHERPDGRGYPYGLTTAQTPLLARIVHVADAFDAMTSARAYRPARSCAEAVRELWRCAGTGFDAEVVQALVRAVPLLGSDVTPVAPAADIAAAAATRRLALVARS